MADDQPPESRDASEPGGAPTPPPSPPAQGPDPETPPSGKSPGEASGPAEEHQVPDGEDGPGHHCVIVRSYPKVIFLYPTFIAAIIFGILSMWAFPGGEVEWVQATAHEAGQWNDVMIEGGGVHMARILGFIFMAIFFCNLLTITTEFNRIFSIVIVLLVALIITAGILVNQSFDLFGSLAGLFRELHFMANSHFYFGTAFILALIYTWVIVESRFDYWEIKQNEILHHHGFLGDVNRFPAPNLQMQKEITDVFEFLLLGSGRLILMPAGSLRPVVLDNVLRINTVEERVQDLLGSISVSVNKL